MMSDDIPVVGIIVYFHIYIVSTCHLFQWTCVHVVDG